MMRLRKAAGFAFLWILQIHTLLQQVSCLSVFELRLASFRNTRGFNANGNCCNGYTKNEKCSTCRTFFRICLTHYQSSISTDQKCTFATRETAVLGGNVIDFSGDLPVHFENPILFPLKFTWPGTFSLIIEAWHDKTHQGPSIGSPRDLITRMAVQRSVEVGEKWNNFNNISRYTQLKYGYRVVCKDEYFGPQCTKHCRRRDDQFGHNTCDKNGNKVCLDGWKGPYCDEAKCLLGCHKSYGTCKKPNECTCRPGWRGQFCNECIPHPNCQHGSCSQPWKCNCEEGWGGLLCNQDLNYCTHHKPCKNGGTCTNTGQGSYTCSCSEGFTGTNCEIEIDNCQHQPCLSEGTCEDIGTGFRCRCPSGFGGKRCEISAVSCTANPCLNSGTCVEGQGTYTCKCSSGYSGLNCEIELNECLSKPCKNDGRCVDHINGFRCVCTNGFSGQTCEQNVNDCSQDVCLNGGTCIDGVNDFMCRCIPGFAGSLCQENVDDCKLRPCANGGTCHDLVNDFSCVCAAGFTGRDCSMNNDDCQVSPCLNGGECHDLVADYQCKCKPGFTGKNCGNQGNTTIKTNQFPTNENDSKNITASGQERENSALSMQHLLLILCLGVGIPLVVIIILVAVLLCRKRHHFRENMKKETLQNEANSMNNKCVDTNIFTTTIPPGSSTVKVTNEEQDFNTYNPKQFYYEKTNKQFIKDCNTADDQFQNKDYKHYMKHMDTLQVDSSTDVGECSIPDLIVKPSQIFTDSILILEQVHRHQKNTTTESMLATEV